MTTWYVNTADTIQGAIDSSSNGDTIIVNEGTYYENIDFSGKAITIQCVDPQDSTTIENTIIHGSSADSVVKFQTSESSTSVLHGLTIQYGLAANGGGIYIYSTSPTIRNCTIKSNTATTNGGGIYIEDGSPLIDNCMINTNGAVYGAGIYVVGSSSNPTIRNNCTITGNIASNDGGGLYLGISSEALIEDCDIYGNSASDDGGGICVNRSVDVGFYRCYIRDNTSDGNGGGIDVVATSVVSCIVDFYDCAIYRNESVGDGGGFYFEQYSIVTLMNCTIVNNEAVTNRGGGIYFDNYNEITITNSILWGNEGGNYYTVAGATISITYSDIEDGYIGTGNISSDPLFKDSDEDDYSLLYNSPCIDVGTSSGISSEDILKQQRAIDGDGDGTATVDMGAFEYCPTPSPANYSKFKKLLQSLLPKGRAWTRDEDSVLTKLMWGLARELGRVSERIDNFLIESVPSTTDELITEFEDEYNIPGACGQLGSTLAERRATVRAKMRSVARSDKAYFVDLAEDLGFDIIIFEHSPFWVGFGRCGDRVGGLDMMYYWSIAIYYNHGDVYWGYAGHMVAGDYLGRLPQLENFYCLVNKFKPAHTTVLWDWYGPAFSSAFDCSFDSMPGTGEDNSFLWEGAFSRAFNRAFDVNYGIDSSSYFGGSFSRAFSNAFDTFYAYTSEND